MAQLQASPRSYVDLSEAWRIGVGLRYVDELPALNIPSYMGAEVRVAKALTEGLQLALGGRNNRHAAFRSASFPIDSSERRVYLSLTGRR